MSCCEGLGLEVYYTEEVPLPFKTGPAIVCENQAQFHPRKYLLALAEDLPGNGSYVFEQTRAVTVKSGARKEVVTNKGSIMASNVVVATHTPVYDPDGLCDHLSPTRSYVLGLYAKGAFPDGMFIDFDPVHTYRTTPTDKGTMIIVAGEHGPAEVPDKGVFYQRLEKYARQHLEVESIEHRWSSTDVTTDDGLPIIGATSQTAIRGNRLRILGHEQRHHRRHDKCRFHNRQTKPIRSALRPALVSQVEKKRLSHDSARRIKTRNIGLLCWLQQNDNA